MSKNALGSIPTFNGVARATGDLEALDIDFKEEDTTEEVEEKKENDLVESIAKEKEDFLKAKEEARRRPKSLYEMQKELINEEEEEIKTTSREEHQEQKSKRKDKDTRPNNKKHLKEGYTRATFAVKDEHLELIKAIASFRGIEQKELLEALLEDALGNIKKEVKEQALESYNKEQKGTNKKIRDLFN